MITQKGRVVYDRAKHKFEVKDIGRILWSEIEFLDPGQRAVFVVKVLWIIMFRFLKSPAARRRFLSGMLDEIMSWGGTVEIVEDWRLTTEKRFRGLPSGDDDQPSDIEGGPDNGQSEGSVLE